MRDISKMPEEVDNHYNNLQRFLDSGLILKDRTDFVRMSMAQIERDTGIKP